MLHVRDSLGRTFDNFTSLSVMWSTSDRELAEFVDMASSVKMMFVKYKEDENLRRALCMYFASFLTFVHYSLYLVIRKNATCLLVIHNPCIHLTN